MSFKLEDHRVDEGNKKTEILKAYRALAQEIKRRDKVQTTKSEGNMPYEGVSIINTEKDGYAYVRLAFDLETGSATVTEFITDPDRPEIPPYNALQKLHELRNHQKLIVKEEE